MSTASEQLPFEIWRDIYKQIFSFVVTEPNSISHPPDCPYVLSNQHARLNVYRCLASVCKSWRLFVLPIFFEELVIHSDKAFKGLLQSLHNDTLAENVARMKRLDASKKSHQNSSSNSKYAFGIFFTTAPAELSRSIRTISFSFYEYRCSLSEPARPRALRPYDEIMKYCIPAEAMVKGPSGEIKVDLVPKELRPLLNKDIVERRKHKRIGYRPSGIRGGSHWESWHSSINAILSRCISISNVSVDFNNPQAGASRPIFGALEYSHMFGTPNLANKSIVESLGHLPNLQYLDVTDPSPLTTFGPALQGWTRLHTLRIRISNRSVVGSELGDTVFIPPKLLHRLEFIDGTTNPAVQWPLSSDLGRCENLFSLLLSCRTWNNLRTMKAMAFLLNSYQHSLEDLALKLGWSTDHLHHFGARYQTSPGLESYLDIVFPAQNPSVHERSRAIDGKKLYFKNLRKLRFQGVCFDTTLFNRIISEQLEDVHLSALILSPVHLRQQHLQGMEQTLTDSELEERAATRRAAWKKVLSLSSLNSLKILRIENLNPLDEEPLKEACKDADVELIIEKDSEPL